MISLTSAVLASAVTFFSCEKCPDRIKISEDGCKAFVNTYRMDAAEKPAMKLRAEHLLERAKPIKHANPMTPLMGWSSWNTFAEHISEEIIVGVAKSMSTNGLKDAGYVYVNIDDGFFNGHGPDGRLRFNPVRFPNGMKGTVDGIHALGMKAGTYSDAGENTCASFGGDKSGVGAGLYGHDAEDCRLHFNELGFDFFKVDYCGGLQKHLEEKKRYFEIAAAIKATGRKDVRLNICRWAFPGTWAADIAGSWRTTRDIRAGWTSIRDIIAENLYLSAYVSPGHFNDLDMLEVGQYKGALKSAFGNSGDIGLTRDEEITHFGMWCIMSSPLVLGCDVRNIPPTTHALVTNPYLIRMNQDPLSQQAYVAFRDGRAYQLVKDAEKRFGTARYVALYNANDSEYTFEVKSRNFDLDGEIAVFDLVKRADIGVFTNATKVTVQPHAARFFLFDAERRLDRRIYEAETAYLTDYSELDESSYGLTDSCQVQCRAYYTEVNGASGGVAVVNLGGRDSNDLIWKNVYFSTDGRRKLVFECASDKVRTMYLSIDGAAPVKLKVADTAGKFVSIRHEVDLSAGVHEIRLFNPWSKIPVIDRMIIN